MTDIQARIYFPNPLSGDTRITLTGDQHHHVSRVLRLKSGAPLTLFDGRGGEYAAILEQVRREESIIRTGEHRDIERESPLRVRLAQGIGRGERTDYAIQKAVELGVSSIVPLLTRRGVVRLDPERARRRHGHWQGIIVHACQQCGRNRIPELHEPATLQEWLHDYESDGLDVLMDAQSGDGIDTLDFRGDLVTLLVGPEGGLAAEEIECARVAGFRSIALGPRTMRTETAAVAGVAALQLKWGDLRTTD